MKRVDGVDPTLLWLLRRAGDEWGPLGVALAAAELTDKDVLINQLRPAKVVSDLPARTGDLVCVQPGDGRILQGILEHIEALPIGATKRVYAIRMFGIDLTADEDTVQMIVSRQELAQGNEKL